MYRHVYLKSLENTTYYGRGEIGRLSYILLLIDTAEVNVLHSLSVQGSIRLGSGTINRVSFDLE